MDTDGECCCNDSPLLSPRRILLTVAHWAWFICIPDAPVYIPLSRMLIYHYRPHACHLADKKRSS